MVIHIGSDHRGFATKKEIIEFLTRRGYIVKDVGPYVFNPKDDYTDYAIKASLGVQNDSKSKGILVCGSGIGMQMVANKFKGIRAAESRSKNEAFHDRSHHNSNMLILGVDTTQQSNFKDIVSTWLDTDFDGGRHARRMKKLAQLEEQLIQKYEHPAIVPIILSNKLSDYEKRIKAFSSFSKLINIDIEDGKFVPKETPEIDDILGLVKNNFLYFSVHLMVEKPEKYLDELKQYSNVTTVYVHIEDITPAIMSEEYPFDLGFVISDFTDISQFKHLYPYFPIAQIMTVKLGSQGSEFLPEQLKKIDEIRKEGFTGAIHLDGGVNLETIPQIMKYKPDVLNVGSALLRDNAFESNFDEIKKVVQSSL